MRKTFLPALLLAGSALAGAGIAATAAPAGDAGPPPAMMDGPGRHVMRHHHFEPTRHLEGRLAFLKAELEIKASQESLWSDFAAASRKSAKIIEDARPDDGEGKKRDMAVPDRLDRAEKRLNARIDALETIKGPATKLYNSLDATQKQMADELMTRPMGLR